MRLSRLDMFEEMWRKVSEIVPRDSSILVTGANGLIASNLVDTLMYFNERYKTCNVVIALCRNAEKAQKRFEQFQENKLFKLTIQDVQNFTLDFHSDYIIHAASNAHPMAYSLKPIETMKTNLLGTIRLLDYANRERCKKFVYVSTSEIYGEVPEGVNKLSETEYGHINTLNPRSCYSESKRCAETLCVCYSKEKEMDVSIVRPGYIYGRQITEDNSRADAQFLRCVLAKQNIVMKSAGEQKRSYCYVADAVTAILYIMKSGGNGEAYNIANSNSEATIKEFAETMADIGGVSVEYEIPSIEEKRGYSMIKNSLLDDQKLRALGWTSSYDLKRGLKATVEEE
ncbi:NAD-dependent epimerase/dehydratase family protein [Mordavella massiliensis]|uniref:NAD-dependent epimerase/dehydratase family protein n=1 Tax=Mordavella massiliensis TaxID=1871024 RepID=A0A939BHI5_9CLOT|nr:NAD-dependent epimerase/dehydratase family protein [Mordavella massiliensis]MBM6948821.1 NAD-dependent epimerase/dehydratase family protein [Mordavella massiliensis]